MGKNTEDYLKEGIYGTQLPKQAERDRYLGTLRERIVLALTVGEVMKERGLDVLDEEMKSHPNAFLMLNGQIAHNHFKEIKELAKRRNIRFTSVANEEKETDIGAVLAMPEAVDREHIFIPKAEEKAGPAAEPEKQHSLIGKIKSWLS